MLQQLKVVNLKSRIRYKLVIFVMFVSVLLYFYAFQRFIDEPQFEFYISSAYLLENGSEENTVRLIAMGPQQEIQHPFKCRNQENELVEAELINLSGIKACQWWTYFIDCKFKNPSTGLQLVGETTTEVSVRLSNPDEHNLVVCFARMFMFENWRIALAAIELYRAHGVDMFSIPIITVIDSLYNILKAYEKSGIVQLTNGVILPQTDGKSNPNHETEFFNQVISNTECLYEFRRSKFIIFADFDDILIPRNSFNIYQELLRISIERPLASSFEFWRDPNTQIFFGKDVDEFDLDESVKRIQLVKEKVSPGKTAMIPSRIKHGFIHKPLESDLVDGFTHLMMNKTDAYFLHVRSVFEEFTGLKHREYVNKRKYPSLQRSLNEILELDETAKQSFKQLPTENTYFNAMNKCHAEIAKKFGSKQEFCPNALECKIDSNQKFPKCTRLQLKYLTVNLGNQVQIHQPTSSRIVTGMDCQI